MVVDSRNARAPDVAMQCEGRNEPILTRIVPEGTIRFDPPGIAIELADCFRSLDDAVDGMGDGTDAVDGGDRPEPA